VIRQDFRPSDPKELEYRVLSLRAILVWAVLIVLVGAGVAIWLLLTYTGGDTEANRTQLDAIRTAGTVVVGTGGAAALLLAARRQRTAEIALKQKDRDQSDVARAFALQEQIAAATKADAEARRITDLYTKAVEQIGSEKAPVRLGGFYALERLAQDHIEQRQTIVNVLCAYLRMPYTHPAAPPADDADDTMLAVYRERLQEREVRLAAQRLLAEHLRPDPASTGQVETFWADIDIDLTSATLINFALKGCTVRTAYFGSATFIGRVDFRSFTGRALFGFATFTAPAHFEEATFTGHADFASITFGSSANFKSATFSGSANFSSTTFADGVPDEVHRFWSPPIDNSAGEDTTEEGDPAN
jgi:hypothetical protein